MDFSCTNPNCAGEAETKLATRATRLSGTTHCSIPTVTRRSTSAGSPRSNSGSSGNKTIGPDGNLENEGAAGHAFGSRATLRAWGGRTPRDRQAGHLPHGGVAQVSGSISSNTPVSRQSFLRPVINALKAVNSDFAASRSASRRSKIRSHASVQSSCGPSNRSS